MSRMLLSLAAATALTLGVALPSADAQNRYSAGRNFYDEPRYEYRDSVWCAPGYYGGFYCYPQGERIYPRASGAEGGYAKNTWRYGLYRQNNSLIRSVP